MASITRDPSSAAAREFDLIVIGGGIHGVMLSLEASVRGVRTLLLEKEDFGRHTSFNSLRIIHGGLRYLQRLDIIRFRESVAERTWFLKYFPHLVKPLPCLMPLYGEGLRRPITLRVALMMNHGLSLHRNRGVPSENFLPSGGVVNSEATEKIFPRVPTGNLKGGAVWFDAVMPQSQRLLIEILKYACRAGATALNYLEVTRLRQWKGKVTGVAAVDWESGRHYDFHAKAVVNAAGPWCRLLAQEFHQDAPSLFRPSLAWNILLDQRPLSDFALAVTSPAGARHTYFLIPWKGKLLVGTGHAPLPDEGNDAPELSAEQLERFLEDLNLAVPGLNAAAQNIDHIFSGFLPVRKTGSTHLTSRGVILHHGDVGGAKGFYSMSGIKFTTARRMAQNMMNRISPGRSSRNGKRPRHPAAELRLHGASAAPTTLALTRETDPIWQATVGKIVKEEAVQHLDDLIFRRTDLWEDPFRAMEVAPTLADWFDWNESRRQREMAHLNELLARRSPGLGGGHDGRR